VKVFQPMAMYVNSAFQAYNPVSLLPVRNDN